MCVMLYAAIIISFVILQGDDGDGDGDGDGDVIGSAPRVVALASFVVVLFSLMMSLLL